MDFVLLKRTIFSNGFLEDFFFSKWTTIHSFSLRINTTLFCHILTRYLIFVLFFLPKGHLPQQLTCEEPSDRVCCKSDCYVILVAVPCAAEQGEVNFMTISSTC